MHLLVARLVSMSVKKPTPDIDILVYYLLPIDIIDISEQHVREL